MTVQIYLRFIMTDEIYGINKINNHINIYHLSLFIQMIYDEYTEIQMLIYKLLRRNSKYGNKRRLPIL